MIDPKHSKTIGINSTMLEIVNIGLDEYKIIDKKEQAMFLAQCLHESNNFKNLEERFKYTPERLLEVFKSRVKTIEKAKELCSAGSIAIANFVYNGRMGNKLNSNDGYNYRGRGIIQLTGFDNYKEFGKRTGIDLINNPDFAKDFDIAVRIALEFWIARGCGLHARKGDCCAVSKIINGGTNGLKEREALYTKILKLIEN